MDSGKQIRFEKIAFFKIMHVIYILLLLMISRVDKDNL